MATVLLQVVKLALLAALVGLIAARWLTDFDAATLAVFALYLLFVRVT